MAGKLSKELMDKLTEFLCVEIGGKVLSGVTYVMTLKCAQDSKFTNKYAKIREEANKCGYAKDELFRIYELSNGYIFDMDLSVAKYITKMLSKNVLEGTKDAQVPEELINTRPNKRRKEDMESLARKCLTAFKKNGKSTLEVAMFSRNKTPRIVITCKDEKNNKLVLQYDAFTVRQWDIEELNDKYLIPKGMRVGMVEACEVLSSKSGVRYILHFEKVGRL